MKKKVVAFIFVRSGSKRLKNKNFLLFKGRPMFLHSVKIARCTKLIDDVFVSTNCRKIINICKNNKIKYIKRPNNLCQDKSKEFLSWIHAINFVKNNYYSFEYFVSLPATNPLRLKKDVIKAIHNCKKKKLFTISVSSYLDNLEDKIVFRMESGVKRLKDIVINRKLKYLKLLKIINGSIYCGLADKILRSSNFFDMKVSMIETKRENSIDIDYKSDLELATILLRNNEGN